MAENSTEILQSKTIVFVVSTGRTGTTFLGGKLGALIKGAHSVHEPDVVRGIRDIGRVLRFGLYRTVIGRALRRTGIRNHARNYMTGRVDAEETKRRVLEERLEFYAGTPAKLIIESYGQWYGLLPLIPEIFPNYRVVGVIRHPFDYVSSMIDFARAKNKGNFFTSSKLMRQAFLRQIQPSEVGDELPGVLVGQPRGLQAWKWQFVNNKIAAFCDTDPHCQLFRFEDIFDPAKDAFQELLGFVAGSEFEIVHDSVAALDMQETVNAAPQSAFRDWSNVPAPVREEILAVCAPLMERFSYHDR